MSDIKVELVPAPTRRGRGGIGKASGNLYLFAKDGYYVRITRSGEIEVVTPNCTAGIGLDPVKILKIRVEYEEVPK